MVVVSSESLDQETLQDFLDEFQEHYENVEKMILALEGAPTEKELLNSLFRSIHTVKGNLGFLGIQPLVDMLQELETILDSIRHQQMEFQVVIGDISLLILDQVSTAISQAGEGGDMEIDDTITSGVAENLKKVPDANASDQSGLFAKALKILDPNAHMEAEEEVEPDVVVKTAAMDFSHATNEDFSFFHSLASHVQNRAHFWQGRVDRVLNLALKLNEYAGAPVEPNQLAVAVCVHDVAMAMLPSSLLNKESQLSDMEVTGMREHVQLATRLLAPYKDFQEARTILAQHHESLDGSGYPMGLVKGEIVPGAQILAICHTFEAITHGHSRNDSQTRPTMRAIMELNRFANVQFDVEWVTLFVKMVRDQRTQ